MAEPMTPVEFWSMRVALRSRWLRVTIRLLVGLAVLITVVAYVGTGPLLHGILSIDGRTIAAALALSAVATAAAAWRWCVIATRLGVDLSWRTAIGRYYQSQFLNTVTPGGIVGDVHRAVAHGQSAGNVARSARAVVLERTAGQVTQIVLSLMICAFVGAQFGGYLLAVGAIGLGVIGLGTIAIGLAVVKWPRARAAVFREVRELRSGIGSVRTVAQVVLASVIVISCHVVTFAIATAAIGISVPPGQLLVLALLVLLGASIPFSIGGWGPREGIAGWAFAVAGFGAPAGVAASALFGVLTIIAVAPGAFVTLVYAARRRRPIRYEAGPVLIAKDLETTP
ncbi:MAG: flippase-like domain-containing protein [Cryobacterium sp.]|uniref:lysylphosphatidylglycerol synthase transmembrane domain-containing protein n=1 Tax=Cryobacterium sp. TaxID=1926290 RepID=UPI002287A793|nr:lysylphosphatidylglycerol synthase transmembrane domain-containing protein [Cryobacterium sp.]MCY7403720.1 flippase-like domain-containing protein [Cryobacterium sp.]